jgi:hypothetical protein
MLGLLDASNENLLPSQPPISLLRAEITLEFDGSDNPLLEMLQTKRNKRPSQNFNAFRKA